MRIYDIQGRHVETFAEGYFDAGEHSRFWEATQKSRGTLCSGLQLCDLRRSRTIMLVK
ncbi:MAG: hypothetical protein WD267_07150 [Balneolales bacterium]